MTLDGGPYMNEDGDWWVPTTIPYLKARREVKSCSDTKITYLGRQTVFLTDCGYDCDGEHKCYEVVEAWHFRENP